MGLNENTSQALNTLEQINKSDKWRKGEKQLLAELEPWLLQRKMFVDYEREITTPEAREFYDITMERINNGIKEILGL